MPSPYLDLIEQLRDREFRSSLSKGRFRTILEEKYGTGGHNKAEMLFRIAWDFGHANGHQEVLNYYDDIVELIK